MKVGDVDSDFLVNTGAFVTVISEALFQQIPNHWNLPKVEVLASFHLSAASGHHMQLLRKWFEFPAFGRNASFYLQLKLNSQAECLS